VEETLGHRKESDNIRLLWRRELRIQRSEVRILSGTPRFPAGQGAAVLGNHLCQGPERSALFSKISLPS
jgi:hypothetical protein